MDDINKLEKRIHEMVDAANRLWLTWIDQQPADDRESIISELESDGARPGIRFIAGDERHPPQLTFLVRTRAGDVESVGALELTV